MTGLTPSQIKAALEKAKEIGALRVRIDRECVEVILAEKTVEDAGFEFDHEDHNEAA